MASTTPRTTPQPAPAEERTATPQPPAPTGPAPRTDAVPMRALLASCRAAEAVSTPPERHAA